MADLTGKAISELPEATSITNTDLLALSQTGSSKKLSMQTVKEKIGRSYTVSELGLTSSATLKDVALAMPNDSVCIIPSGDVDISGMENASAIGEILVVRSRAYRTFAIGARTYVGMTDGEVRLFFAAFDNTSGTEKWWGFKELANLVNDNKNIVIKQAFSQTDTPSQSVNGKNFSFTDNAGNVIGYIGQTLTSDNLITAIASRRVVNGTAVSNYINLGVKLDGSRTVSFADTALWRKSLGLNYAANDTESFGSNAVVLNGIMNGNLTTAYFDYVTEKSMENISTITVTSMTGTMCGVQGAVTGSSGINFTASPYSISCVKLGNHHVRIGVSRSPAYTNVIGNSPVNYLGTLALRFT